MKKQSKKNYNQVDSIKILSLTSLIIISLFIQRVLQAPLYPHIFNLADNKYRGVCGIPNTKNIFVTRFDDISGADNHQLSIVQDAFDTTGTTLMPLKEVNI